MPVSLVGNEQVLVTGNTFVFQPLPSAVLYQVEPRSGPFPIVYETINPAMRVEAVATGGCPLPAVPELITGIKVLPGHGTGATGVGCKILDMIDLASEPVPDIPEMVLPVFREPFIEYGAIVSPTPAPALTLPAPLIGYYSEKYFYDAEYMYSTIYDGVVDEKAPLNKQNRVTMVSLLNGKASLPLAEIPRETPRLLADAFPAGVPINFGQNVITDPVNDLTAGNFWLQQSIPEVSVWNKFQPSYIHRMQYFFTVIVTHTCPPFATPFFGTMTVENNWTAHSNRLQYYISQQKGIFPLP